MKITITLHTKYGQFESDLLDVSRESYEKMIEENDRYFEKNFKFALPNGGVAFVSPDVLKESILEFKIKRKHVAE